MMKTLFFLVSAVLPFFVFSQVSISYSILPDTCTPSNDGSIDLTITGIDTVFDTRTLIDGWEDTNSTEYTLIHPNGGSTVPPTINDTGAYSGDFGACFNDSTWLYRLDTTTAQGDTLCWWVNLGDSIQDATTYLGFGSSALGTISLVLDASKAIDEFALYNIADYTSQITYVNVSSSSSYSYLANKWYMVQAIWDVGGNITGTLFDSDSTTVLTSITGNIAAPVSGGIALRGLAGIYIDDISRCDHDTNFTQIPSYLWSTGDSTQDLTDLSSGFYTVTVSLNGSVFTVDTVHVWDSTNTPVVSYFADTVCLGDSTSFIDSTLFGGIGTSYMWDFNGDSITDDTSQGNTIFLFDSAATYPSSLIVTNSFGCSDTASFNAIVNLNPTAMYSAAGVCEGSPVQYIDSSLNVAAFPSYIWDFENDGIPDDFTIGNTSYTYPSAGSYATSLIVNNNNGCVDTFLQTVTVDTGPAPDFFADTVCFGETTTLTDSSEFQGVGAIYYWDFDGDLIADDSTVGNTSTVLPLNGNNNVSLIIIKASGCADTLTKNIVTDLRPEIALTIDTVCDGELSNFLDNTTNTTGGLTYLWDFENDGFIDDATVGSNSTTYPAPGDYTVSLIVINGNGCSDTALYSPRVDSLPVAMAIADTVCFGLATSFTDQSSGALNAPFYEWDFDADNNTDDTTAGNTQFVFPSSGSFSSILTVTNLFGCSNSDTLNGFVHLLPNVSFSVSNVCPADTAFFTDQTTNADSTSIYMWDFDGNDTIDDNTVGNTSYSYQAPGGSMFTATLTVTNENGCTDSASRLVTVSELPSPAFLADQACENDPTTFTDFSITDPGSIYSWDFDNDNVQDDNTVGSTINTYSNDGVYTAQLTITTPSGCVDSFSTTVFVDSAASPSFTTVDVCHGNPTIFTDLSTGVSPSADYWWDFDGDGIIDDVTKGNNTHFYPQPGTFNATLTIINANGCDAIFSAVVNVNPIPDIDIDPMDACIGDPVLVVDNSTYEPGAGFAWDINNDGSIDNTVIGDLSVNLSPAGVYPIQLVITQPTGCSDSILFNVEVFDNPVVDMQGLDPEYCIDQPLDVLNLTPSGGTLTGPGSNGGSFVPALAGEGPHSLTYFYIDQNGCTGNASQSTIVHPLPTIEAGPDQNINIFQEAPLFATGGVNYTWIPPTYLNDHLIANPIAKPIQTITYTLIGTDVNGCSNTDSVTIFINSDINVFVPTGFSPNGDGQNDFLKPLNEDFDFMRFSVYNRWGEKVYETTSLNTGWNGKYNQQEQEVGVYSWKLEYRFPGQQSAQIIGGTSTLIR